jgi:hypothetical protein
MNEKDIRDRIAQFLKKTARTVIVPASMGIGLSSTACNGNGLRKANDAGLDSTMAQADAANPGLPEDAIKHDVPMMMVPYVVAMALDAAAADVWSPEPPYLVPRPPDAATDSAREVGGDADKDTLLDLREVLPPPPPPYLIYLPAEELRPAPASPPEKKK